MSQFRISFGNALAEKTKQNDILSIEVCRIISEKISAYKAMEFSKLKTFSEENSIEYNIDGKTVHLTFYKKVLDNKDILLVVQAAYKTLKFPNYFSFGFIGKIIVDGVRVNASDEFAKPDAHMLLEFM